MKRTPKNSKVCPRCLRPFSWRKKWEREWAHVVYCSKACREGRYPDKSEDAQA